MIRKITLVLLAFATLSAEAACGGDDKSSGSGGSGTGSTTVGSTATGATSSGGDATTGSGGSGGADTSTGTGGAAPQDTTLTLTGLICLDLATGATDTTNPCKGDIIFLQGANVDLQTNGNASPTFCTKPGTFQSLASIPKDYSTCTWDPYVEGAGGLANTGYVLRDAAGTHHYRFWIVDNKGSTITFQLEKID